MRSCIVLGGAASAWDDLRAAREAIGTDCAVIACNDAGAAHNGPLAAWVTLHKDKMPGWIRQRRDAGFPEAAQIVFHEAGAGQDELERVFPDLVSWHLWPGQERSGSSGLFGVKVALELGFDRIVLCGIPMTTDPHFHDAKPWEQAEYYQPAWIAVQDRLAGKVRSMSGWTAEQFGQPDQDWINA